MKCFSLRFAFFRCFVVCVALTLLAFGTAAAEFADFSSLYPDTFLPAGSEPQWTEDSYTIENMAVKITAQRVNDADVYVADIYVRTVECLQRSFAGLSEKRLQIFRERRIIN